MRMNVAAYPPFNDESAPTSLQDRSYSASVLSEILANGEALYDPAATTKAQDDAAARQIDDQVLEEISSGEGSGAPSTTFVYSPAATSKYATGVSALEWVRGNQTVLTFRGSYTPGDFAVRQRYISNT